MQDSIRELRAHIDRLLHSSVYGTSGSESYVENCLLPLSPSQSRLLADLVTVFVGRSTWWSTQEEKESWVMFGVLGEASGPQVTLCITATSDRDVITP